MTTLLEIPISDELLRRIEEQAKQAGADRDEYIRRLLSQGVEQQPTLHEILKPFRDQIEGSGLQDEEFDSLLVTARGDRTGSRWCDDRE